MNWINILTWIIFIVIMVIVFIGINKLLDFIIDKIKKSKNKKE